MKHLAMAVVSLSCTALLTGCGTPAVTSVTPAAVLAAQGEQLAEALAATEKYGPSCEAPRGHLVNVLPTLVGLGKGTMLPVDALPLLTTAQEDLTRDAATYPGLSAELLAVADDFGRIRVALATLKAADLGPLTTHLKTLAVGCSVN